MRQEDVTVGENYWMNQTRVNVIEIIPAAAGARHPIRARDVGTDETYWTSSSKLSVKRPETMAERNARQYREAGDGVRKTDPDWQSTDDKFMISATLTHRDAPSYLIVNTYEWGEEREEVVLSKQDALSLHAWLTKELSK